MSHSQDDIAGKIQEVLSNRMMTGSVDLVDIVPIPKHGDRMVRLRTVEEALEDFDRNASTDGSISYLIQVRPAGSRREASRATIENHLPDEGLPGPAAATAHGLKPAIEGTYLPNGKLNVPYLLKNAELLAAAGDTSLARNIYKAILSSGESGGSTAAALQGLAGCFKAEGKLKEAQAFYEEAIAYHNTLENYLALATLLTGQNQDRQAADVYTRALHLKDTTSKQRFELHKAAAFAWSRGEDAEKAVHHYQQALEIMPGADDIRGALGCALLKAGRVDQARNCFREAIAVNPRNDAALFGLGSCALAQNDKQAAHDYFAKSLSINLNNATAVFHLVKCAYELKNYSVATGLLEQYMDIAPVNTNLLYSLAGLQFHLSRFEAARNTLDRIFQIAPNHAGAGELSVLIDRYLGKSTT